MEDTIEITYNNSKYVLADNANINGTEIYHFVNYKMIDFLTDDKSWSLEKNKNVSFSLFCTKENNTYIPIKDKRREKQLLLEFGMELNYIIPIIEIMATSIAKGTLIGIGIGLIANKIRYNNKKVDDVTRERFIQEQKENYRQIKQKLGIDIDLNRIESKLDKIIIKKGKIPDNSKAFYNAFENSVNFKKATIDSSDLSEKKTRLHETNHYMAGRKYGFTNTLNRWLLEGANNNLVIDYFDDNTSSFYDLDLGTNYNARVQYNFMESSYPHCVSLVKQLEYITGVKSYESSINGNSNFFRAVIRKLGVISTIKLCVTANRLENQNSYSFENLKELQNMIMHTSFNKEFENIQIIQDAKSYLERLRDFELYRGKITALSNNGDLIRDNSYKDYYTNQHTKLQERFGDRLEEYRYKGQEMKPTLEESEEKIQEQIKRLLMERMIGTYEGDKNKIARQPRIEMLKKGASWVISKINGKVLEIPIIYIGNKDRDLYTSITWKEEDTNEAISDFMKTIGATKTEMTVKYTDEEVDEQCKSYKETIGKLRAIQVRMLTKEPSLMGKIKRKIFSMRRKKHNISQEEKATTEQDKKKASWDLSNWEGQTNSEVQNIESPKPTAIQHDIDK